MENIKEYELVDFLVYNKYIKMNLPDIEIHVAEYAIINSEFIFCITQPNTYTLYYYQYNTQYTIKNVIL